jgi:hypothetical protein
MRFGVEMIQKVRKAVGEDLPSDLGRRGWSMPS